MESHPPSAEPTLRRMPVITIGPEDTVEEAARLLLKHRIGGLPVVRGGADPDAFRDVCAAIAAPGGDIASVVSARAVHEGRDEAAGYPVRLATR